MKIHLVCSALVLGGLSVACGAAPETGTDEVESRPTVNAAAPGAAVGAVSAGKVAPTVYGTGTPDPGDGEPQGKHGCPSCPIHTGGP